MRMLSGLLFALIATSLPVSAQERPGTPGVITKGSDNVSIGGKPAARQGDTTTGGNVIVEGSKNVFINGKPAAITSDKTNCGGVVIGGGGGVFINGKPAARSGDQTSGCPR
ncbi:putative Zn-binding protein involved in type VI secretion [Nitrobacteraceae bacterium AZCC 1564]